MSTPNLIETSTESAARELAHDHARLDEILADVRSMLADGELERAEYVFRDLHEGLLHHIRVEDELLFPLLEKHAMLQPAAQVMRQEHRRIVAILATLEDALAGEHAAEAKELARATRGRAGVRTTTKRSACSIRAWIGCSTPASAPRSPTSSRAADRAVDAGTARFDAQFARFACPGPLDEWSGACSGLAACEARRESCSSWPRSPDARAPKARPVRRARAARAAKAAQTDRPGPDGDAGVPGARVRAAARGSTPARPRG